MRPHGWQSCTISTNLRYRIGKGLSVLLDSVVSSGIVSASSRLPVGWHLELDVHRFVPEPLITVVDAGANRGDTVARFARFFPRATIYAFEPVASTFALLQRRFAGEPRVHSCQMALGEHPGSLEIQLSDNSELNSLRNKSVDGSQSETITVTTLDESIGKTDNGVIDLLKIDTEGYELPVLRGASSLFRSRRIRAVFAEVSFVPSDRLKTPFAEVDRFLQDVDFKFSGFYQLFRWGPQKKWAGFANGLWLLG